MAGGKWLDPILLTLDSKHKSTIQSLEESVLAMSSSFSTYAASSNAQSKSLTTKELQEICESLSLPRYQNQEDLGLNVLSGKGIFPNFPLRIIESNYLPPKKYRTEYYRGVGGYKNKWNIRKERQVELPDNIYLFQSLDMLVVRPETALILRNCIP